ncbi:MAG: hypothetical protein WCR42_15205 [bacterium]
MKIKDPRTELFWKVKNNNEYNALYESGIQDTSEIPRVYEFIKNLSYNTQYLEFLNNSIHEDIHAVVHTELIKTFVITGIGVIECILYYFLKKNGWHKINNYEDLFTTSSTKKLKNMDLKIETTIKKKLVDPVAMDMNFNSILRVSEKKDLLNQGGDHSVYATLNKLRKLRNKTHLFLIDEHNGHDLNNFNVPELNLMKETLKIVLYSKLFKLEDNTKNQLLDFLEPKSKELIV